MHAYNKLQTPSLTGDGVATKSEDYPPKIDRESYQQYIYKYQAAFETCAHAAVPKYLTRITNYTNATHWSVAGELLLLLAASVAFVWAWVIKTLSRDAPEHLNPYSSAMFYADGILSYISVGFPVVLTILGIWRIAEFSRREFLDNQDIQSPTQPIQQSEFLGIFVVIWWILYIALFGIILVVVIQMVRKTRHLVRFWNHEYERTANEDTDFSDLNEMALYTQIAIDLPVIVGLTFIAVGTSMQQAVSDFYVIMTVIVFFTLIGLKTHITNVLRIMHLIAQWEVVKKIEMDKVPDVQSKYVESIKYNRVAIGLLIALMLYAYVNLAGLDSYQGATYGGHHQIIFAVVAFFILCVSDLTLEFLCLFQKGEVYPSSKHYF
jgi:hypothetical protein